MTSDIRYYAAACQTDLPNPRHRDEIKIQVDSMLAMIDETAIARPHTAGGSVMPRHGYSAPAAMGIASAL